MSNLSECVYLVDFDDTLIERQNDPANIFLPHSLYKLGIKIEMDKKKRIIIVTGRSVEQIDQFFYPVRLPVIGGHGAQIRLKPEEPVQLIYNIISNEVRTFIIDVAKSVGAQHVEDKKFAMTVHISKDSKVDCDSVIVELRNGIGDGLRVDRFGDCLEIRPEKSSKGSAILEQLNNIAPRGNKIITYIGDDVGYDCSLQRLKQIGATLIHVGISAPYETQAFENPSVVRNFLLNVLSS